MTNDLTTAKRSTEISQLTPPTKSAIWSMWNALERRNGKFVISAEKAPSSEWKSFMGARAVELDGYLVKATDKEIADQVRLLVKFMRGGEGDPAKQTEFLAGHVTIIRGVPLAALQKATIAYLRNEAGDKWMPPPGEIRQAALKLGDAEETERLRIRHVLSAETLDPLPPYSENRKVQIEAELRRYHESVVENSASAFGAPRRQPFPFERPTPEQERQSAEERLAQLRTMAPVPRLSTEALATFGIKQKQEAVNG